MGVVLGALSLGPAVAVLVMAIAEVVIVTGSSSCRLLPWPPLSRCVFSW